MPGPIKVDDIVVLIPGIMGSVLTGPDGSDVWAPSVDAVLNALLTGGGDIQKLQLAGPCNQPNSDGITATRLFPDVHLIPGFWTIDGYTKIDQNLRQYLGITLGQNYYQFPYDWRQDNRVAAKQLLDQSQQWLAAWRNPSSNPSAPHPAHPNAKLIIIAHSMGGLIARYFIECLGGWKNTRMLITFGTPFHGSVKALQYLVNGYKVAAGPFTIADLSPIIRSFPAAYQLLPEYPCIETGGAKPARIADLQATLPQQLDPLCLSDAIKFYSEMADAVAANKQVPGYKYDIHAMVGTEQVTELRGAIANGAFTGYNDYPPEDWQGDTTVPWNSAHPVDNGTFEFGTYYPEVHGSIQNGDDVLQNVRNLIDALNPPPWVTTFRAAAASTLNRVLGRPSTSAPASSAPAGQNWIAVQMSEVYIGQSVGIDARVAGDSPAFADVTDVKTGVMIHQHLALQPGPGGVQNVTLDGLPQGIYRIRLFASDAGVRSITNLFTVLTPP